MPTLTVATGERAGEGFELDTERFAIGRGAGSDLCLDSSSVSSEHCAIVQRQGRWIVQDMESTNGTLLNGTPVREARLRGGDRIRVGEIELLYEEEGDAPGATASQPAFAARPSHAWRRIVPIVGITCVTLIAAVWFLWKMFFATN